MPHSAYLLLENGHRFDGIGLGPEGIYGGESVFNTAPSGYFEILTDPSYAGQIVVMTSPHIGNYGINHADAESTKPYPAAFIVREISRTGSNYRNDIDLPEWAAEHNLPILTGIDTRAVTRQLRSAGAMRSVVCIGDISVEQARAALLSVPGMEGAEWVSAVSTANSYEWTKPLNEAFFGPPDPPRQSRPIVVMDFGVKRSTLRHLVHRGLHVRVVPWNTGAGEILAENPAGVLLSNGPGDPATLSSPIAVIKELLGQVPIFGICLGHQLLARAIGARTFKLPFGHHGANHPVRDVLTNRIEITSQNHGFAVDSATLPPGATPTHWNLYDGTLEGFQLAEQRAFAVQFHPEAAPGPSDSNHLFDRFLMMMQSANRGVRA